MKKSYELADMFLKGKDYIQLSPKQYKWLNDTLIKENITKTYYEYLFFNTDVTYKYKLNGDFSLYKIKINK